MKIDVIIPLYNMGMYILDALRSVEEQMRRPDRIWVVNDGSTDDGPEKVREFARNSKMRVEVIDKENGGLSSARNAGIVASDADWIALLDADDMWMPEKLERQVCVIEQNKWPDLGLVYCNYHTILSPSGSKKPGSTRAMLRGEVFHPLLRGNYISASGSGVLIKKSCFVEVGLFDETLSAYEDWDMWLRLARRYRVDYAEADLVVIRRHAGGMQGDSDRMQEGLGRFYAYWTTRVANDSVASGILSRMMLRRLFGIFWRQGGRAVDRVLLAALSSLTEEEQFSFWEGKGKIALLRHLVTSSFR